MKRFPCYFIPVALLRRNRPLLFFTRNFARSPYGIGICDDIAGIFDPFLRLFPVSCPVYFHKEISPPVETSSDPTASSASQSGLWGLYSARKNFVRERARQRRDGSSGQVSKRSNQRLLERLEAPSFARTPLVWNALDIGTVRWKSWRTTQKHGLWLLQLDSTQNSWWLKI
jgi:hypothetical protein